jgi:hypothetical protein
MALVLKAQAGIGTRDEVDNETGGTLFAPPVSLLAEMI